MILYKLSKKEFYLLAKAVLAELDEAQSYYDNSMTRSAYEDTKIKYGLCDLEIEYLRKLRGWPFVLKCKDGATISLTSAPKNDSSRYNEKATTHRRNRNIPCEPTNDIAGPAKSNLSIDEQLRLIKDFNRRYQVKPNKKLSLKGR